MYLLEDDISEIFKNTFTYYLVLVSIILFVAPLSSVEGAHEFNAYRMHQFDFNSVSYGCRGASVNLELHSLVTWSTARHCIVTWLLDMSIDQYRLLSNKAGCLLLVLPRALSTLRDDEKTSILTLEKYMMSIDTLTPTYFAHWSPELEKIATDVTRGLSESTAKETAFQALVNAILGNRYQLVISASKPSPVPEVGVACVYGNLPGRVAGADQRLPSILLVAHYDTAGIAPELASGLDNNGSGVIALLELARLFSALFGTPRSSAQYNLSFLLTGGGKVNFIGARKFLDTLESEDEEGGDLGRRGSVDFVICLEALAASPGDVNFFLSKPPKPGTPVHRFHQIFSRVAAKYSSPTSLNVTIRHKKINLQDAWLAWEHEHFSMRKYRAFTMSALESHNDIRRNTILDTKEALDVPTLTRNIKILAESLASYIYNIEDAPLFESSLKVEPDSVSALVSLLSHSRRSLQLAPSHSSKTRSSGVALVDSLAQLLSRSLRVSAGHVSGSGSRSGALRDTTSKEGSSTAATVRTLWFPQDRREPELVVYSGSSFALPAHVYTVKSIVLDLVLALGIGGYLAGVYGLIVVVVPRFM